MTRIKNLEYFIRFLNGYAFRQLELVSVFKCPEIRSLLYSRIENQFLSQKNSNNIIRDPR